MTVPAEVFVTDPLTHQYFIQPQLNGGAFDPYTHGGAVEALILRTPVNNAVVHTSTEALRLGYGLYRFDVPGTVPHATYTAQVRIRHTATSDAITGDFGTISVPARPKTGIVPWATYAGVTRRSSELYRHDPAVVLDAIDAASHVLYMMSGRKYRGRTTITELYRCEHSGCYSGAAGAFVGVIASAAPGYSHARRGPSYDVGLNLRSAPVYRVLQVSLDSTGRVVSPHEYEVQDGRYLMPRRGARWHPCSGVRVTYEYGANPPQLARNAAEVLAAELAKGAFGLDGCRLPERVSSISRQGVSYTVLDPQDFLEKGRTGLYEVDLFLASVNPDRARTRARVFTPGGHRARRTSNLARRDTPLLQDFVVQSNINTTIAYDYMTNGVPVLVTGRWAVRAFAGEVDLAPYIDIEPGGVTGRIVVDVPANIAASLAIGSTWYLDVVSATESRRLITGTVRVA